MLTIVLSGPKTVEAQARTALAAAGLQVDGGGDDHGLPPHPEGKKAKQAVAFVSVRAPELEPAVATAARFGLVLRMHFETPPAPEASPLDVILAKLGGIESRLDRLEA